MPSVSEQIRDKIFAFENAANLSNNEMRILIDEIGDDHLIATALKGADDDVRFKFLRNMSQNRATDILSDMDAMGCDPAFRGEGLPEQDRVDHEEPGRQRRHRSAGRRTRW